ncbi:MAG: replication factor C large subunit, partial [Candidatus ainarchaeum sp.]|nr:replication factor C large subunit [Candidatus ainarchaeum sp.]
KEKVRKWILDWERGKRRRPILIYGPSGTGKTSFAYAVKNEFEMEIIEMNASQFRNKKEIDKIINGTMLAGTLSGKRKIILIDDVDVLDRNDRGGASEISRAIKDCNIPVILTAEDAWAKNISSIRMLCELIQLRRISKGTMLKIISAISEKEGFLLDKIILEKMAENSNGDIRSAINDLQSSNSYKRDHKKDVFNVVREIFKGEKYSEVRNLFSGDVDYKLIKLWVDENIPYEYLDKEELAKAYYFMSRSDQFEGRIGVSDWGYLKYVIDFFSSGVALSKNKRNMRFVKYNFPGYLKEMAGTVKKRAMLKSIGQKIGAKTHTNYREAREFIPLLTDKMKKNKEGVMEYYKFTDEEAEFIEKMPFDKIKIKK